MGLEKGSDPRGGQTPCGGNPRQWSRVSLGSILPGRVWSSTRKFMTEKAKVLIVLTTCPTAAVASKIANALVEEQLAACVNRLPGVTSTYIWEDVLHTEEETMLLIKTTEGRF